MKLETFFEKFDLFADAPDAVAKMRELILQIAVQGRLVEPSCNDEPVQNFLRRIWADKSGSRAELVDVEKAQPFEVPDHWRWVVLSEVSEFSIGKTPPRGDSSYWYPEDHSWVSIADMKHYGTVTETKEKVSAWAAQDVFRQRCAVPGSILMSFKLTIGKVARAGIRCFHNEAIISLLPPEPELTEYLFRFLPLFAALQTSNNAIKGSTLNKGLLTLVPIALPPLGEQKRIVARVDELMVLCDRLDAQHQKRQTFHAALARASLARFTDAPTPPNLELLFHRAYDIEPSELRKSILTLAVQGKLVPQDPSAESVQALIQRVSAIQDGSSRGRRLKAATGLLREVDDLHCSHDIPESWAWCRLGDLVLDFRYGTSRKCDRNASGVPVLRIPNIQSGRIDSTDLKFTVMPSSEFEELRLRSGDLLIVRSNGSESLVGRSAVAAAEDERFAYAGYLVRARLPLNEVFSPFIQLALNTPLVRNQIEGPLRTTSGVKNINTSELANLVFPLPPLAEQRRIVVKVEALLALVGGLEDQLANARIAAPVLLDAIADELTAHT